MRVNFLGQLGTTSNGFETSVVTNVTSPLFLHSNPTGPLEAAPKQYVDTILSNLSASNIKTGTISANRLPAYTGDLISATGSGTLNLSTTGITTGTYTKVTVNTKGRVIGINSLTNDDIPVFSWNKIVSGKPTTVDGYGITDAVKVSGGVLMGILTLNNDPVEPMHAANKQYVDSKMSSDSNLKAGDIIRRPVNITPTGFLRCNGGQVSKTEYSALYSIIGDTYSYSLTPGSGKPWRQQYYINIQQSTDITGWTTGTSLPGVSGYSQAIVTKNRVYLLGGYNSTGAVSTVYTAPINEDGTLGTWTDSSNNLPGPLGYSQAIVTKNRVYLLGGYNSIGAVSTVYTAPINEDGTLGTWATGTSLPVGLYSSQAIVTKNRVYLLGGNSNGDKSTVYTAPINEDGTLGTWATGTSLPVGLYSSQAIVTKNRVYLLGGNIGSGLVSTVRTAPFSGGLNDYSSYYDGSITSTDPSNFRLPDLSKEESSSEYYFIKY